jgi:molecular chaperone HtpG
MSKHTTLSLPTEIIVGKDILELVSSAMYVDPLTIYREYVQNAVDSIDDARLEGVLDKSEAGRVDISIDLEKRVVTIRDNGGGVPNGDFAKRLTALGGSRKRGTSSRGFRGVGRLAGLGYCQELVFRSRAVGDRAVQELRWDCRKFKTLLLDHSYRGSVRDLVREVASVTELKGDSWPKHFYEVELIKPVRIKNDLLMNNEAISFYLSQFGPVPFSPKFKFGAEIKEFLERNTKLSEVDIFIDDSKEPLYRPYRNRYSWGDEKKDSFTELEFHTIEGVNGDVAAVAWLLHHGYHGSIPSGEGVAGLRARKGNIQVGDHRIFSEIFPEARFAAWTVGEVHVLDERVIPNGRRDEFEQNAHYTHVKTRLGALGDHIARMCRTSSVVRNRIKAFDVGATKVEEQLRILEQGALDRKSADVVAQTVRSELHELKQVMSGNVFGERERASLARRHSALEESLRTVQSKTTSPRTIESLPKKDRATIQRMIALIYECSTNRLAAKSLVDRILARLGAEA